MGTDDRAPFRAYGVAVAAVLVATALRQALQPWLGSTTPYAVHFLAVLVASVYGGLKPGLLSVGLSAVLAWFLFVRVATVAEVGGALLFTATGSVLSLVGGRLRSAQLAGRLSVEEMATVSRQAQVAAEQFRTTLASIGDAVIVTDARGAIDFMNPVAESLTGWKFHEARRKPLEDVFRIVNEFTRATVESPVSKVMREGTIVGLANHTILITKNGGEVPIDDSGAPIRDGANISGIVLVFRDVTARRQSEAALRESEERFRRMADSAPVLIWESGSDKLCTYFNKPWLDFTGRTMEQERGNGWAEGVHPDDLPRCLDTYVTSFDARQEFRMEYRLRRADGQFRWILDHGAPRVTPEGAFLGYIGCCIDITERREAEQHRAQLAAIVESSDDAIIGKTLDGSITSWNSGAQRMYGYTAQEVLGRPISMLIPPGRPNDLSGILERLARGERIDHYETQRLTKDGRVVDVAVTVSPIRSESREIVGASAVTRDITERRRAEAERVAAARRAQLDAEQFRTTLASIGDAVIVTAADGSVTFMNAVSESLTGWKFQDARGIPLDEAFQIVNEFTRAKVESPVSKVIREGTIVGLANHTVLISKNGIEIPIDDSGAPIRDSDGNIGGIVLVFRDVTGRRRAEAERAALLEREKSARAEAEDANRLKDEFLATLSHELRTPLQAILGFSRLLRAGRLDPEKTAHAIQAIERNADAQAALIDDLLDVSRVITGKFTIDVRPVELSARAEAALDSVRPAADAKGVTLSVAIDPQLGLVPVDAHRIQQAIWNLLSNAVRFTPPGGQVSLQVARVGSSAQITVSDTGIGIAPEFLPHVFERFRQAQASTTRSHGGLGLGLSIVRHIVEVHGGTVEVASEGIGRGATFRINLPLRSLEGPSVERSRGARHEEQEPPKGILDGICVLIVDDQPDSRELLTIALQNFGALVRTAGSAPAALHTLRSEPADVLVSDIGMPGEDGFSLIREIRALGTPVAGIPAIALTGFAMDTDRDKAVGAGFQMHVVKPVDPSSLALAVAKLAGRK